MRRWRSFKKAVCECRRLVAKFGGENENLKIVDKNTGVNTDIRGDVDWLSEGTRAGRRRKSRAPNIFCVKRKIS